VSDPDPATLKLAEALEQILARPAPSQPATPAPPAVEAQPPATAPAAPVPPPGPAQVPEIPAAPPPAGIVAAAAGPQPPPGKAPLQTLDDWEKLPEREQLARMDEVDQLLREGQS
jgi:hypothetical protein